MGGFATIAKVVIVIAAISILLYLGWLAFITWYETKHAKRVEMFICDYHGMLPKASVLNLSTYLGTNYEMCPICYRKRLQGHSQLQ